MVAQGLDERSLSGVKTVTVGEGLEAVVRTTEIELPLHKDVTVASAEAALAAARALARRPLARPTAARSRASTAAITIRKADRPLKEVALTRGPRQVPVDLPPPSYKILPDNIGSVDLRRLTVPRGGRDVRRA